MVNPEFSEFQYTYGLTREIENHWSQHVIGTPYFPTQNMEAKIGSDVVIGISQDDIQFAPLFMQYKRSEWMTTGRAAEWDEFNESYFRFSVHSKNQHNTLVELGNGLGKSIYVAPGFYTIDEYSKFHQNQELATSNVVSQITQYVYKYVACIETTCCLNRNSLCSRISVGRQKRARSSEC